MQEALTKQQQAHEALKEFCEGLVSEPQRPEEVSSVVAEEDVVYTICPESDKD